MFYVYILKCKDGSLYTGIAKNVEERIIAHESGKGSKYVRSRLPVKLVYKESHKDKQSALKRELEIKSMKKRNKKILLGKIVKSCIEN